MMKIIKIKKRGLAKILREATKAVKEGKVLVCPSDTVYGLVCDAKNEKAVRMLFKIKKRSLKKPIPLFVKDIKMAKKLARMTKDQEVLLKKFWPGKVTAVLACKKDIPGVTLKGTIGLRMPKYKLLNALLEKLNHPLAQTSANVSGQPASTKIKEVLHYFEKQKHQPDLVLDAGDLKPSLSSTVIDLTRKKIKILRKGAVSFSAPKSAPKNV